jgi:DNA polymerase-3 subunit delta
MPLKPLYLIASDEILLRNQARDQVRELARQAGFLQQTTLYLDGAEKNQHQLWDQLNTQDLFSDKLFIQAICSAEKKSLTPQFIESLIQYCKNPNLDNVFVLLMPKLSPSQLKSTWFKAFEAHGDCLTPRAIYKNEWPNWLQTQAKKFNLKLTPQGLSTLDYLTEGHLLAAYQALEKMRLLFDTDLMDTEHVLQATCDQSRQSVFDLSDCVLAGKATPALRSLMLLKNTGVEPILILWSLARDCRDLGELLSGSQVTKPIQKHWQSRANLLKAACRRLKRQHVEDALILAQRIDGAIKGRYQEDLREDPWILLEKMILILTGLSLAS